MKKIFNILFVLAMGLSLSAACTQELKGPEFVPEEGEGQYTFAATSMGDRAFSYSEPQTIVNVYRAFSEGSSAVQIHNQQRLISGDGPVDMDYTVVDVPSKLEFADGETTGKLKIGYNKNMAVGEKYQIALSLDSTDVIVGGEETIVFEVSLAYEWESLGICQYYDAFIYKQDEENLNIQKVELLHAKGYDRWKIIDPFAYREVIKEVKDPEDYKIIDEYDHDWEFWQTEVDEKGIRHLTWKYDPDNNKLLLPGVLSLKYDKDNDYYFYRPREYETTTPIYYNEEAGVFELNPYISSKPKDKGGSGKTYRQKKKVCLALPGVDLAAYVREKGYD